MHEVLFLLDDNLKALLVASASLSLPVYVAVDAADYRPEIQPPYFVIKATEAVESEAYQAENYNCTVDFYIVVDPKLYDQTIRDECGKVISLIKQNRTPDLLTTNGLTVQTIGVNGSRFRREMSDRMWKFVGAVEMFAYLTP